MNKKHFPLHTILAALLLTLFVAAIGFTGAAHAYTARSTTTSAGRWIARSHPVSLRSPALIPLPPAPAPAPAPAPQQPPTQPAPSPPVLSPPALLPPAGGVTLNVQEQLLLNLVNSERIHRGLRPLQLDARLTHLARLKSQDMIDHRYFAHLSPVYGRAGDMIRNAGIPFILAAENIGVGGNVRAIFTAFMNSSGHRNKIISSRYTLTGIGIIHQSGRGFLVTQLFVQPR
jgi:uncharacterized protein YkwD